MSGLLWMAPAAAQEGGTRAAYAFMVDAETGTVLLSKEADKPFPPASLAKLMTVEIALSDVAAGKAALTDAYQVSEHAWRTGGAPSRTATMFAALKSTIPLVDLLHGAIVLQANDACIVIAEGLSGQEAAFAERMNARAKTLGLGGTRYVNPTGFPAKGQMTTARDLVTLSQHLWRTYPDQAALYAQSHFKWNNIDQPNRNPLLKLGIGADGIASGYDEASGYAIVATASAGTRRVFLALGGLATDKERTEESRRLIEWSRDSFRTAELFKDGETIGEAQTFGGDKSSVKLAAKGPVSILLPAASKERLIARIVYDGPVPAPVQPGTPVGRLKVWVGDRLTQETPLFAAEAIGTGSLTQRALDAVEELLVGWLR